jgi:hypothetical protein
MTKEETMEAACGQLAAKDMVLARTTASGRKK